MEQAQKWMSRRSEPSVANKALNVQIDKDIQAGRQQHVAPSTVVRRRSTTAAPHVTRDAQGQSANSSDGMLRAQGSFSQKSKFVVLDELTEEDDITDKLSAIKQMIMDIPDPSGPGGKAHARNMGPKHKGPKVSALPGNTKGPNPIGSSGLPKSTSSHVAGCSTSHPPVQRPRPVPQQPKVVDIPSSSRSPAQSAISTKSKQMDIDPAPNLAVPTSPNGLADSRQTGVVNSPEVSPLPV